MKVDCSMRNEKGFSIIAIIVAMLFLSLLGTVLISQYGSGVSTTINEQAAAQSAYVAESAQELALRYLIDNPNFGQNGINPTTTTFSSVSVGNGTFGVSSVYPLTALSAAMTNAVTSANVYGTTIFPSSGRLRIDSETMTYTGKSANTFTGLSRGTDGTTAVAHSLNAVVYPATVLTSALTATATTIAVSNTAGFLQSGILEIESELMDYSGLTASSFTGVRRGSNGTTAVTHSLGQTVWPGVQQCQITTTGTVGTLGDIGYGVRSFNRNAAFISDSGGVTGTVVTTVAGNGIACPDATSSCGDGDAAVNASLDNNGGIDLDPSGQYLYIADSGNNKVRRVDLVSGMITTIAGTGPQGNTGDGGLAVNGRLNTPEDVAVNSTNTILYIADSGNRRVRAVNLSTGIINSFAGTGANCSSGTCGDGGAATSATLNNPRGVDVDTTGTVYISDKGRNRIRKVVGTIISAVAGSTSGTAGDVPNAYTPTTPTSSARFRAPEGIRVSPLTNNYVYVADTSTAGSNSSKIRLINISGASVTTVAGITGVPGTATGDGGAATSARMNLPQAVIVDSTGNLYITDSTNHRIRMVNTGTGGAVTGNTDRLNEIMSTVAGTGVGGYNGENLGPLSAQVNVPGGMAMDPSGNIYISDTQNHRVRRIGQATSVNILSTVDWRENFQ